MHPPMCIIIMVAKKYRIKTVRLSCVYDELGLADQELHVVFAMGVPDSIFPIRFMCVTWRRSCGQSP
jgi:hypothetical protein